VDFETSAEFRKFYSTLRNRTMDLVRYITEAHVRRARACDAMGTLAKRCLVCTRL